MAYTAYDTYNNQFGYPLSHSLSLIRSLVDGPTHLRSLTSSISCIYTRFTHHMV